MSNHDIDAHELSARDPKGLGVYILKWERFQTCLSFGHYAPKTRY